MDPKLITFLKELKKYGIKKNIPNVTETVGKFLNMMIKIKKPKHILEIGCANGYSTLWMAEAAQKVGARITAIDFSEPTFKEAQRNIQMMGFDQLTQSHLGNALKIIPTLQGEQFAFVFIDGQKKSYFDFWNVIQSKITDDAVIVFDDILAFPEKTKTLTDALKNIKGYQTIILPIDEDDGILLIVKE